MGLDNDQLEMIIIFGVETFRPFRPCFHSSRTPELAHKSFLFFFNINLFILIGG